MHVSLPLQELPTDVLQEVFEGLRGVTNRMMMEGNTSEIFWNVAQRQQEVAAILDERRRVE